MNFTLTCDCGKDHSVSEGSAGSRIRCECGLAIAVPSLAQLRSDAGLAPVDIPLEFEIPALLESGLLPKTDCADCGRTVADVMHLVADCEQVHVKNSGGFSWGMFLISGGRLFLWEDEIVDFHGRDTMIPTPAHLCSQCRQTLLSMRPRSGLDRFGGILVIIGFGTFFVAPWNAAVAILTTGILAKAFTRRIARQFQRHLRQLLMTEPVYRKLFDKYPDAIILIERSL